MTIDQMAAGCGLLVEQMMTDCVRMVPHSEPDGLGGSHCGWRDEEVFRAAIVRDRVSDTRVAEKQAATSRYTVTAAPGARLRFHTVLRRLADGRVFRVVGDASDSRPPACAGFDFEQAAAEPFAPPGDGVPPWDSVPPCDKEESL